MNRMQGADRGPGVSEQLILRAFFFAMPFLQQLHGAQDIHNQPQHLWLTRPALCC